MFRIALVGLLFVLYVLTLHSIRHATFEVFFYKLTRDLEESFQKEYSDQLFKLLLFIVANSIVSRLGSMMIAVSFSLSTLLSLALFTAFVAMTFFVFLNGRKQGLEAGRRYCDCHK